MIESNMKVGGTVTFWTCGPWSDHKAIRDGFESLGLLDYTPEKRSPSAALKDALGHVCSRPRTLIRPLDTQDGFCVVEENRKSAEEGGNDYRVNLVAKIDPDTKRVNFWPTDQRAHDIVTSFNEHLGLLSAAQVSKSLVEIMSRLGGVRLRPTGGVYWLPESEISAWAAVARVIEGAAKQGMNNVYLIRHEMDFDAVKAVRDAIVNEVEQAAKVITSEVMGGELGERGLENRKDQAIFLRNKVNRYEDILGAGLDSLKAICDEAEQAAATAAMMASAAACRTEKNCVSA